MIYGVVRRFIKRSWDYNIIKKNKWKNIQAHLEIVATHVTNIISLVGKMAQSEKC